MSVAYFTLYSPFTCWHRKSNGFSSVCTGSDNLFLGSNDGQVRILSQAFKVIRCFPAHETGSVTHMKQVEGTSLLVTISEDLLNEPVLKVWALDKTEKKTGSPKCLSTLSLQNGRKQFPVGIRRENWGLPAADCEGFSDLRLCSVGELVTARSRLCQWICHSR